MLDVTDEDLLTRAATDPEAFAAFYRRHAPGVLRYCVKRTRDPDRAADVMADTFAAALEGAARYTPDKGPAVGWLYGIAKHQLAQQARRGAVERRALTRIGLDRTSFDDAGYERVLHGTAAETALDELPADLRHAVSARVVDEHDCAHIAAATQTTEAAVRQRVSRGLKALRRALPAGIATLLVLGGAAWCVVAPGDEPANHSGGVEAQRADVVIVNAGGRPGAARAVGAMLLAGPAVRTIEDAPRLDLDVTTVYYGAGRQAEGERLAQQLGFAWSPMTDAMRVRAGGAPIAIEVAQDVRAWGSAGFSRDAGRIAALTVQDRTFARIDLKLGLEPPLGLWLERDDRTRFLGFFARRSTIVELPEGPRGGVVRLSRETGRKRDLGDRPRRPVAVAPLPG